MNVKKILTSSAALAVIMTGCGGGGGDTSGNNNDSTVSGTVADGYLEGATVFLDKNDNGMIDVDLQEPTAITTKGGKFTLHASKSDIAKYPLVVSVPATAIDEDTNMSVGNKYTLSAPNGETFISPVSTLVKDYMDKNDVTVSKAKEYIAGQLGINIEDTYTDFVKQKNENVHKKAKVIANLKAALIKKVNDAGITENSAEAKAIEEYVNGEVLKKLSNVKTAIDVNNLNPIVAFENIREGITLSDPVAEISTIENKINEEKAKKLLKDSPITDLTDYTTIQQNTKYSKSYAGGITTDFKNYTIADSNNSVCTLYPLETTNVYNPYGPALIIDERDYTDDDLNSSVYLGTNGVWGNVEFNITWYYYTTEASHIDFYVNCVKRPAPVIKENNESNKIPDGSYIVHVD